MSLYLYSIEGLLRISPKTTFNIQTAWTHKITLARISNPGISEVENSIRFEVPRSSGIWNTLASLIYVRVPSSAQ
jgi:hypothetical protein